MRRAPPIALALLAGAACGSKTSGSSSCDQLGIVPLDFGAVDVGGAVMLSFQVENLGSSAITVTGFVASGSSALTLGTPLPVPTTLESGDTVSVTVSFAPTAVGQLLAQLQVVTGSCSRSAEVTGTAVLTGGAGETPGSINVTLTTLGVHPAARAALQSLGLDPPSLLGGFAVELQAVTLQAGSPSLSTLGTVPLTAANLTGPIEFPNISLAGGIASLGLQAAIVSLSGTGTPSLPSCAQVAAGSGFIDGFVPAASQLAFGTPTADITAGAAFALPASFVALLDCAAGLVPNSGTELLTDGFALLYGSSQPGGLGSPLDGLAFGIPAGNVLYYPAGYAPGSATAASPTTSNGVATVTGIVGLGTVNASGSSGSFPAQDISSPPGSAALFFFAPD